MALPSQMARSGQAPARVMGGGRRAGWKARRRRRVVAVIALLLIGGIGFIFWPDRVSDAQAEETPGEAAAEGSTNTEEPGVPPGMGRSNALVRAGGSPGISHIADSSSESGSTQSRERTDPSEPAKGSVIDMGGAPTAGPRVPSPESARVAAVTPVAPREAVEPVVDGGLSITIREAVDKADELLASNKPVDARDVLNRALHTRSSKESDRAELRMRLARIADNLTFSAKVVPEDSTCEVYTIQSGDVLARIVSREGYAIEHGMLQRLNAISDPRRIRVGQRIKALKGPFHCVVDKDAYRLDLYADQTDSAGNRLYLRSFAVGIGEIDSDTPVGAFRVRQHSKLVNPRWVNPRTGEVFEKDNPENPIGERWIGLEGIDDNTATLGGYGIHGTIEPQSVGARESMGCIRMLAGDVELIYDLLVPLKSTVLIVE